MRLPNDIIVHYEERVDGTGIEGHYAGELIRCRECKYYDARDFRCETYGITWFADDFCSNAERKE